MIAVVLAGVLAAGHQPMPSTLAGVRLGASIAQVLAKHPDARRGTGDARWWQWPIPGAGTVTVTTDDADTVNRVSFVAAKSADGSIDLPCAGDFRLQDSETILNRMLDQTPCSAYNGAAYGFPGGSIVALDFVHNHESGLVGATWFHDAGGYPSPVGQLREIMQYLRPVLKSIGGAARIYYGAECSPLNPLGLSLPMVSLRPAANRTGIDAVRYILRDNPNVVVTQDRSGMVRITIGSVATPLLDATLPAIELGVEARARGNFAAGELQRIANDYAAQRRLPFRMARRPMQIIDIISSTVKPVPILPAMLQNVTLDNALDTVARAFHGVVAYGACVEPGGGNLFAISFDYGASS